MKKLTNNIMLTNPRGTPTIIPTIPFHLFHSVVAHATPIKTPPMMEYMSTTGPIEISMNL